MIACLRCRSLLIPVISGLLAAIAGVARGAGPVRSPVRVVYFIPSDRQAEPNHAARIGRVMETTREFYRDGMRKNGHGDLTFDLERDASGGIVLHEVRGAEPSRSYGRDAASAVGREVKAALAREGIDTDRETLIIFQTLLEWQGDKAVEVGPYVGGGGPRAGTAWVFDDRRLDPRLLSSREPGGYYGGPCSIGAFNTHYIGGVIHELGHAFGLPHDREQAPSRAAAGLSIMGGGNHTFGREQRGEGPGAFLSPASALPLSVHPRFTGRPVSAGPAAFTIESLTAATRPGRIVLEGRITATPAGAGIVARNDPRSAAGDYDAVGWICPIDGDGRFSLSIGEIRPGDHDLRIAFYLADGSDRRIVLPLRVDPAGRPDLRPFVRFGVMRAALAAARAKDDAALQRLAAGLGGKDAAEARAMIEHLRSLAAPGVPQPLADVAASERQVALADAEWKSAKVGWGQPQRNRVIDSGDDSILLEADGRFFPSGLYAHAPSRHEFDLGGRWKVLETSFGLQDGHGGSVVFVVKGDGRELFRSPKTRAGKIGMTKIDVAGVTALELVVEDAGDGGTNDWGLWLAPTLSR